MTIGRFGSIIISLLFFLVINNSMADAEHPIEEIRILGGEDLLRLQVEAQKGTIAEAALDPSGKTLHIAFTQVDKAALTALIEKVDKSHPLMQRLSVVQPKGQPPYLLLALRKPVTALDETLVTLGNNQTRWEIVLSPTPPPSSAATHRAAGTTDPGSVGKGPVFGSMEMGVANGLLNIVLLGNPQLTAEVSFLRDPHRLIVDLPQVSVGEIQSAITRFKTQGAMPTPNIRAIRIGEQQPGVGRMIFDLAVPLDLAESSGTITDHVGRVLMGLVPDGAPTNDHQTAPIKSLELREEINGKASVQLTGLQGSLQVDAYMLQDPARLMLDFIGFKPEQLYDAVAHFKAMPQIVRSVRYGETRLGSARVELALTKGAQVADLAVRRGNEEGSVIVASLAPRDTGGSDLAEAVIGPGGERNLDLRFRPEHDFHSKPSVVIKPVVLENAARFTDLTPPPSGLNLELLAFYEKALTNDATYQAAKAEYLANAEAKPQALAGYLPVAAFSYERSSVQQNILQAMNASFPKGKTDFSKDTLSVTITQPLIQVQKFLRIGQADRSEAQANTNLLAAEQEMILRVATTYLNMLAARDGLDLARMERESTEKQAEQARINWESGLGTEAQFHEVEGRAALTQSKEIKAKDQLEDARNALKEIIGDNVEQVRPFKGDFEAAPPQPANVETWVHAALTQNLALQTRVMATEIATMEVNRQRAGHLPTVDLVGSVEKDKASGSLYGLGEDSEVGSVGVRLNVPLFAGGLTSSMVREALARQEKATQEMEQERRRTERFTRAAFQEVQGSSKSLAALRKVVLAQENSLKSKLVGYHSGLETVISVLDSFRLYYASRRDYLQARYDYLVNRLKLKQAVGNLGRNDLEDLSALLQKGRRL
ncbi:MAG: TolC family outer membrane protein [Magnetococcales bacterium]|nr:TolC family outer membrane protein [Magnetococcales bacterium]